MVGTDAAQKKRIAKALKQLQHGTLAMREFASAVGKQGAEDYETRWQEELAMRAEFSEKPEAIREYEGLLHIADFHHNRGEGISSKRKRQYGVDGLTASMRAHNKAEAAFENALEHLEETLSLEPGLRVWLDREVSFDADEAPNLDPESVPRVITSRSSNCLSQGMAGKKTKADIKREILEEALAEIEHNEERVRQALAKLEAEEHSALKVKLAKLKSKDV